MNRDPLAVEMEGLRTAVENIIIERDELKRRIDKSSQAVIQIAALKAQNAKTIALAEGFMSESNYALFVQAVKYPDA